MVNVGARKLTDNSLMRYGVLPIAGGTMVGGAFGVNDKYFKDNPNTSVMESMGIGALAGAGLGFAGIGFSKGYKSYKTSLFIENNGGLSAAQQQMARKLNIT
jgi:hypothetical protein